MANNFYAKSSPLGMGQSAMNTTMSSGTTANYQALPRGLRRSHTTEKGFRTIDLQVHGYTYDKPAKNDSIKETIQSPYMNGRKNETYKNPTFHSSFVLNQSVEIQRSRTPDAHTLRRASVSSNTQSMANMKVLSSITPREPLEVNRKIDFVADTIRPVESELRASIKQVSIKPVEAQIEKITKVDEDFNGPEKQLKSSRSAAYIDACHDCHNWQLADETAENRRKQKQNDKELERQVLEYNSQLLRAEKEKEKARKDMIDYTYKSNYEAFNEKRTRAASRDRNVDIEDDITAKPNSNSKSLTAEAMKNLKRYQSMLDKMYESSMKRQQSARADLNKSQHHNRSVINNKDQSRTEEKNTRNLLVEWNTDGEKSLLDNIHDRSTNYMNAKSLERRRASEYNHRTGSEQKEYRKSSPGPVEDPFKADGAQLERAGDGKGMLDKMYQSSLDYWKRRKDGLNTSSQWNKDTSATKKQKIKFVEEEMLANEYSSPNKINGKSLLDNIHSADERSQMRVRQNVRECSGYNRSQGFSEEGMQMKANTMENYYKSPTKKVGNQDDVDYDTWTNQDNGVFKKINGAAERLEQDRRIQLSQVGFTIRQQMEESAQRKKEEQVKERNHRERPLLVCSHNANLMYCGICNRKVPSNKISKIIADYNKLSKHRGPGARKCNV